MIDIVRDENERLKRELRQLRQTIIHVDPMVTLDGRFEEMMASPKSIITIARDLLEQRQETAVAPIGS